MTTKRLAVIGSGIGRCLEDGFRVWLNQDSLT